MCTSNATTGSGGGSFLLHTIYWFYRTNWWNVQICPLLHSRHRVSQTTFNPPIFHHVKEVLYYATLAFLCGNLDNNLNCCWNEPHDTFFIYGTLELVSKELNHFGVIADFFRQIGGHSSRFVLFCSFWRLFTIKIIKSLKLFAFYLWKIIIYIFYFIKIKLLA